MNFLFRVDAGRETGLGHFYRSLALAEFLNEKGHTITFLHQPSGFWEKIKNADFSFEAVELRRATDFDELGIIKNKNIDVLYVDGIIEFSDEYLNQIKKTAKVVFYQNLSSAKHLADVFILPSIHQSESFFEDFDDSTQVYKGLEYFTFNPILSSLEEKEIHSCVKKVGIITGGSDPENTLMNIYNLIDFEEFKKQDFYFYYGEDYMHKNKMTFASRNNIHFQFFDHQKVIKNDLLISAFGVSTYEFMSKGMPIIAFGHQETNAQAASMLAVKTKSLISVGLINMMERDINIVLKKVISNYGLRSRLSKSAKEILDLKGVDRVANILEQLNDK